MSIYTRFNQDDIVPANQSIVTTGLWTGDTGSLEGATSLFLSDDQLGKSGEYYFDVYNTNPATDDLAEVQFAIAYGNISGSGAPTLEDDELSNLPTAVIYSQYRNLLLDPDDTKFSFEGSESDQIYVINFNRARFKEQLDPGNWQLPLSGANGFFTFVDDSNQTLGALTANSKSGRRFRVVSGTIEGSAGTQLATGAASSSFGGKGYGYVYPDLGVIVLNPDAICPLVGFHVSGSGINTALTPTPATGSAYSGSAADATAIYTLDDVKTIDSVGVLPFAPLVTEIVASNWSNEKAAYNQAGLYASIKNAVRDASGEYEFRARSAETISSTHYFVRMRNSQYNYSNNPTFRDSDNVLIVPEFKTNPQTYVTTVGLFNDTNELLAVAKLSKPVRKSFEEEILLRVRLDF